MIQNIEISKIRPHYRNPRKDLGDLTELAESIKHSGIFQNLTVVPWFSQITGAPADDPEQQKEMGYVVVIGHRRLAAAKLAGLTEVPCIISDMDMKQQVATMMLENMQRNDLTLYEQAEGFQMMLDFGETIENISQKTGLSKTTVRSRVKLLDFDKEKLRKSVERGATLSDYAELDKIEDIKLKNSVLDKIGTPNFKWELQQAISKEAANKNKAILVAELEKFAKATKDTVGLRHIRSYSLHAPLYDVKAPDDADTQEYFFEVSSSYVTLYAKNNANQVHGSQHEYKQKHQEENERRNALKELSESAYQLRCDFIKGISNALAKKNMPLIIELSLMATIGDFGSYTDIEEFTEFVGITTTEDEDLEFSHIKDYIVKQPERSLLLAGYLALDSRQSNYFDWQGRHKDNEDLNAIYDVLVALGYELSDEEVAMKNGTHKLLASKN